MFLIATNLKMRATSQAAKKRFKFLKLIDKNFLLNCWESSCNVQHSFL